MLTLKYTFKLLNTINNIEYKEKYLKFKYPLKKSIQNIKTKITINCLNIFSYESKTIKIFHIFVYKCCGEIKITTQSIVICIEPIIVVDKYFILV